KRSLLVSQGVFNQGFTFGSEDIELGHRLSRFGLKVIYNRQAVQYMNRPLTYDDFCRRCEKQGRSQVMFSQLHADRDIQQYCQVVNADVKWREMKSLLKTKVQRVHEIEALLASKTESVEWNM